MGAGRLGGMDLATSWTWLTTHPAQAAWAAFGLFSALVGVYRLNEKRIKEYVASTETKADDKLVRVLDATVAVFEVLRLFAPHFLARPKEDKPDA